MYDKQKQKASANLIPDQSSLTEHLRRAKYQAIIWSQYANQNIYNPNTEDYGLVNENGLKPCWFTCSQLPPSLTKRSKKGKKKDLTIGYEADTEAGGYRGTSYKEIEKDQQR